MSDDRSVIIIIFLEPPVGAILRADFLRTTEAGADKGAWRLTPPMYDVRCTMYDCDVRARCAEGRRQTEPAYVRRTTRTTAPMRAHALAGGKCVWTARMRCPDRGELTMGCQ